MTDNKKNILEVKINSLALSNENGKRILFSNINFEIASGSIYALVGKNGIGKTTLLNSFLNLLNRNIYNINGEIIIDGNHLFSSDGETVTYLRKKIVRYIFQDAINSFDPLKKLRYYFDGYYNEELLDKLLEYFLLPKKDILLNFYPFQLSGGMAQRIAIIYGIISKPKLLMLDEPNSALDIPISNLLSKKLKEISRKNKTAILIVTQDFNFALNTADTIGLITESSISEFKIHSDNLLDIKTKLTNSFANEKK